MDVVLVRDQVHEKENFTFQAVVPTSSFRIFTRLDFNSSVRESLANRFITYSVLLALCILSLNSSGTTKRSPTFGIVITPEGKDLPCWVCLFSEMIEINELVGDNGSVNSFFAKLYCSLAMLSRGILSSHLQ
jgi:hypothetical protein